MTATILIAALAVFILTDILLIALVFKLMDNVKGLKFDIDSYRQDAQIWKKQTDAVLSLDKSREEIFNKMCGLMGNYDEQIKELEVQYQGIMDSHKMLCDHYDKILDVWEGIDEKYSNTYEQFKLMADAMKKMSKALPTSFKTVNEEVKKVKEDLIRYFEEEEDKEDNGK